MDTKCSVLIVLSEMLMLMIIGGWYLGENCQTFALVCTDFSPSVKTNLLPLIQRSEAYARVQIWYYNSMKKCAEDNK